MEFYRVVLNDGIYMMEDDEEQDTGVELTQEQMGILMDKLGSMYNRGNNILTMRKYCLAYYNNAVKEYVNLSAIPSMLIHEKRLENKFSKPILCESFSITLLEGEEENRISIYADGGIESRGFSVMQVIEMMDEMVSALNETALEDIALKEITFTCENMQEFLENSRAYFLSLVDDYSEDGLDFNQTEMAHFTVINKNKERTVLSYGDTLPTDWQVVEIDLLHRKGHFVVSIDGNTLTVKQRRYPWEVESAIPFGVSEYLRNVASIV